MAEVKYESKQVSSACSAHDIYGVMSNLNNITRVRHLIPEDKVRDIETGEDFVRFKVDGLGQKICLRIVDKEQNSMLKFGVENIPMQANFWIQMKEVTTGDTRLRLTLKADIPMMFKMMLESKLKQGIDQAADMLAAMPFDQWNNA